MLLIFGMAFKKIARAALFSGSLIVLASVFPLYAGGARESSPRAAVARASSSQVGKARILAAYVVDDSRKSDQAGANAFAEGMYLPQAAAAYFPTPFSVSSRERKLSFDAELPYRILSKSELGSGVLVYTIETTAQAQSSSEGRTYSFTFPRSSLGQSGAAGMQPAPYALERAIRISELTKGVARLESLRYDEASGVFKTNVRVSPLP